VIVNLGVFFALHVFWPRGAPGGLEWPALLIAIAALAALVRLKANVIHVIVACALAGLLAHWLRLPSAG
jgi:chromate transporter